MSADDWAQWPLDELGKQLDLAEQALAVIRQQLDELRRYVVHPSAQQAPVNAADIRRRHFRHRNAYRPDMGSCGHDNQPWPCEAIRLLDELEAARAGS